ncbi:putative lipid II flippase FtsW [Thiococcus pfennigii]|jgi:cell division protein FtsW|uniref:putative lipid II flippase FtsW n=1 Tax=Thiococcus pfennigii TaxID=1057 RepID=UPI00190831CC|nr:putative lipid II flippase FtsW [Thiococcus pfennigii]MBK1699677.1 putative lipid II flippase FtsW [Thiococcus pfennigii]MBK1731526.1 putative lipid II flippase FtsW [Thiococcus pfennigii]
MSAVLPLPRRRQARPEMALDYGLLACVVGLLGLGVVMVASASMPLSERLYDDPLHVLVRHGIALSLALAAGLTAYAVPTAGWERARTALLLVGVALLVLVLVPGVGHTVNGATRWIPLGPLNLQSSEFMKLFAIIYVSGYLVRHSEAVTGSVMGFVRPMVLVGLVCALIIAQPDFGTVAVIMATVIGLLFLGGVQARHFVVLVTLVGLALAALVVIEPYRVARVLSFLDPFADAFDSGYQLSQALIAFGRGEWLGVGLGNGIQKQFFLPEPHTDFIAAVVGEELGLAGVLAVIAAFAFIIWRAFVIGARAFASEARFAAFLAYGIGLALGLQAFVNLGVNLGVLPTKGLTLPFLSYGSNSLIVACMGIGMLLRIDGDLRRRARASGPEKGLRWVRA